MQDLLASLTIADINTVDGDHAAPMDPFGKQRQAKPRAYTSMQQMYDVFLQKYALR
jgi:hypothetical protein